MEKAAVSLMISLVSPVITKLAEPYFGGDVTEAEIDKLKCVNIPLIVTVIQAAEKIKAETLKPWLMKLKEIAYQAEDLLDMYEYNRIHNENSSLPSSLRIMRNRAKEFFSPAMLKTELKTVLDKIQQSADGAKSLIQLLQLVSTNSTIQPGSVVNQQSTTVSGITSEIFGRDEERDCLINLLIPKPNESSSSNTNGRKRIPVYSLYGIGGAGKTTLAQYIYNDERVKSHFDKRIWIEVTHKFNAEKITREIIDSINRNAPPSSGEAFDMLQNNLKRILPSKKILLVLDNIWCEKKEFWDQLLIPFNEVGEYGSRIIITARSEEVGLALNVNINMPLKELENDDCWSILMDHATDGSRQRILDPELIAIGKKIVWKLKKSPLALRMVGSLLGKKIDVKKWEHILKQDMLEETTMGVLFFSFQNLPIHLQRCFSYCSLYPKGFQFKDNYVKSLVIQWIAAGFVEPLSGSELTLEELGMKYLDALVSYSFFQKDIKLVTGYKIHDLLHDLAEKISKDSCYRIESEEQLSIPATIKHLSIRTYKEGSLNIRDILNLVNLRTFLVLNIHGSDSKIIIEKFDAVCKKITKLRVLCLYRLPKMPRLNSIGKLKLLRYLDVYLVKELPESLGKLYHLQYLRLGYFDTIPKSLCDLVNLRRFIGFEYIRDLEFRTVDSQRYGYGKTKTPKMLNIAKLILLEQLNDFYPQKTKENGMKQLKNLQQLRGALTIHNLENVNNEAEASEARVNRKTYLRELMLEWDEGPETKVAINTYEEVLNGLEPHPNLKQLVIKNYMGFRSPKWMVHFPDYLPNLQNLVLISCHNLTELHYLPRNLQILILEDCPKLNKLPLLPCSLVRVEILNCPKLEDKLCLLTELKLLSKLCLESLSHIQILPDLNIHSLTSLRIVDCSKIVSLPNMPPSLTHLFILNCPKLNQLSSFPCSLVHLEIRNCPELEDNLCLLTGLNSLSRLHLDGLSHIQILPVLNPLMEYLYIHNFPELISMGNIVSLPPSLEQLNITNCPKFKYLPILPASMRSIFIRGCDPEFMAEYREGGPLRHKIDHIPHVVIQ